MKYNWQSKKLGEVCDVFADGDWVEKKDQSFDGIRLIQTGNVGNGVFKSREEKGRYISEKTFDRLRCTEIFPNDCLISRLPDPVGRACIIPDTEEKMITAVDCTIIRFRKETTLSKWFVYYSLSQEYQNQINKQVSGATRQRISRSNLGLIEIPLPPLPEQKRIVKILDEVFGGIAKAKVNAEKNLANARELFESYLQETFNKPQITQIKKIEDICEIVNGGTPDTKVVEYWNGEHLWITPKDMGQLDSIYVGDTARKITASGLKNSSAKMLPINSVILSSRAPIGHLAINTKEISTNQGCKGIVPKKEILTLYLFYFLKSSVKLLNSLGSGTTFKELSGSKLAEVQIPLPNLPEQRAIIVKLDALSDQTRKLEAIYQKKLAGLEELKKSVLKKAFEGEL